MPLDISMLWVDAGRFRCGNCKRGTRPDSLRMRLTNASKVRGGLAARWAGAKTLRKEPKGAILKFF